MFTQRQIDDYSLVIKKRTLNLVLKRFGHIRHFCGLRFKRTVWELTQFFLTIVFIFLSLSIDTKESQTAYLVLKLVPFRWTFRMLHFTMDWWSRTVPNAVGIWVLSSFVFFYAHSLPWFLINHLRPLKNPDMLRNSGCYLKK